MKPLWVLMLVATLSSACARLYYSFMEPLPPKVRLTAVQVESVSLAALRLNLKLLVQNPNDFEIRLRQLEYQVVVDKMTLARGSRDAAVLIAEGAENSLWLPVDISVPTLMKLAPFVLRSRGRVPADAPTPRLVGVARVVSPLGEESLDFNHNVKWPRLP